MLRRAAARLGRPSAALARSALASTQALQQVGNVRAYAKAAAASKMSSLISELAGGPGFAVTVDTHGPQGRYASALFMAAQRAGKVDDIEKDLTEVYDLAEKNAGFGSFLRDPSVPKKQKTQILDDIFKDMKVTDLTKNFFEVLVENNRLQEFPKIVTTFEELVSASRGQIMATLTTAERLPPEDVEEIKSELNGLLQGKQTLEVEEKVDPSIIGGMIIDIGDKHIDLSLLTRVKKIQQLLRESI